MTHVADVVRRVIYMTIILAGSAQTLIGVVQGKPVAPAAGSAGHHTLWFAWHA